MARFPWQKKKEKHIEIGRPTRQALKSGYTLASDHNLFASDPAAYLTNNACSLAGNMKTEGHGRPGGLLLRTSLRRRRAGARTCPWRVSGSARGYATIRSPR